jgi:flagella basal body P-ring formation protein FlgA
MHGLRALLLAGIPLLSQAGEATFLHVDRSNPDGLQRALLDLAQQSLEAAGLVLDREHVWLMTTGSLQPADEVEARPTWSYIGGMPALPLTFELRAVRGEAAQPVRATLAVKLQRPAWIAQRRLRKGSQVSCSDFAKELRQVRDVSPESSATRCQIGVEATALRDIAAGEALRMKDIGRAPDVQIGLPVQVSASSGVIRVTTMAIALADAQVGDQIDVRLQHPTRTLRTRVTGRGAVQLVGEMP